METIKLEGHRQAVTALSIPENEQYLLTGGIDKRVVVWDKRSKQVVKKFRGNTGGVNAIQMSPDCRMVAMGCTDGTLRIWDFEADKELFMF